MKVLGILGSPHTHGHTMILLDAVLDGAKQAGADVEKATMSGLTMNFCVGCSQCHRTGRCFHDDDTEVLKDGMLAADAIVLGSPVYIRTVSAQMKALMDRCSHFIHCFLLEGKYGAAVATAGGSGEGEVAEYQNHFLRMCGAQTVGAVGALAAGPQALQNETAAVAQAAALGADLVAACREQRQYPEQEPERAELFARMKYLATAMGPDFVAQYDHWQQRGWL